MKKLFTLSVLVSVFVSSFSQITYNITDVPSAPSTQRIAQDTFPLPTINFGNKGTNQVYDFSNLVLFKYDTAEFRTPTSGQLTTFPNADVATTADGINFLLTNTDNASNKLTLEGFQGQICAGQTIAGAYSTKPDLFHFPTTYLSNFGGTAYLQQTVTAAQVCQSFPVSNVRLTTSGTYTDTIDGWGKVITPLGAYKCLRKQRKETTTTTIEAQVFGIWNTVSGPTTTTTIRYTYVTKEAKGSVVNFNYDTANVLQSVNWAMVPPTAPVADFSFVLGAGGSVAFTDLSDFYPTSWAWTFGDAGTSTSQNPTHVYATNGTYNVCLIATNAGGSSVQVCKQVVVSNAAMQPVAAFTWANPSGGLVNFTDQSTNTPTSWAWTFGDGGNSSSQSPSHVYTANGAYYVCLTATNAAGSNTFCDSVHVTNISAINNAPVAVNDTASVQQPDGLTLNVGTNDIEPDGDNFCLTLVYGSSAFSIAPTGNCTSILYTPDSTFVGSDTCYYVICDGGSPALCDTGMFVVNSVYNPALVPVAGITDLQIYFCTNFYVVNNSLGADSIIWHFHSLPGGQIYPDTTLYNQDTVNLFYQFATEQVCLTAYNQFGSSTMCDTVQIDCESLHEISLSSIQFYPNPATNLLTIDMRNNNDEAVRNYSAIEIYNALGERVKSVNDRSKTINISVAELTNGVYLATLVDSTGARRMLGRFVVEK